MPISVRIEADNAAQFLEELRALAAGEQTRVETEPEAASPPAPTQEQTQTAEDSRGDPQPEQVVSKQSGPGVPAPTQKTLDMAREMGIDVNDVQGSGKDGRVTQADLKEYARHMTPKTPSPDPENGAAAVPETDPFSEQATASEDPEPLTIEPTKGNAILALKVVNEVHDMDACLTVLSQFGARRIGDVPGDEYARFIEACGARVGLDMPALKAKMGV